MGFLDLFRPKWKHSDPSIRAEAVRDLTEDDRAQLEWIIKRDRDPRVRRLALKKISDVELLGTVAEHDPDDSLRRDAADKATELLLDLALDEDDEVIARGAVDRISIGKTLADVACRASFDSVRKTALEKITEPKALVEVARKSREADLRNTALERIEDAALLRELAAGDGFKDVAMQALERLVAARELEAVEQVSKRAKLKAVQKAARDKLGLGEEAKAPRATKAAGAPVAAPVAKTASERDEICQRLETITKSDDPTDFEEAEGEIASARSRWQAAREPATKAQSKRFERAVTRLLERRETILRKHQRVGDAAQAERRASVAEHIQRLEADAERERLEQERRRAQEQAEAERREKEQQQRQAEREKERLVEDERRAALREKRTAEQQQRQSEREAELKAAQEKRAAEEQKRSEQQQQNLVKAEAECQRLEDLAAAMAEGKPHKTKQVEQTLKNAQQVMTASSPLPREKASAVRKRYDEARAKVVIQLHALHEREDWERFANVPKLELLCQKMDILADAQVADPPADPKEVAMYLKSLQAEWKSVGPAPKDKSEELWARFKAKGDQIYERLRAATDDERAENLKKKTALCERVEALVQVMGDPPADATDWKALGEQLKALQAEWKATGPGPGAAKEQVDALWTRFKTAADKVFAARKARYTEQEEERGENLKKKEALCAQAESLALSIDWKLAGDRIKALQVEWKAIGPAPREQQEALWTRFRAACDRFFERRQAAFEKIDEDRQKNLVAKEALCAQVEAIVQKDDLDQEAAESEVKRLQAEWKRIGPPPQKQADAIWARFRGACDQVFQRGRTVPESVSGMSEEGFRNRMNLDGVLEKLREPGKAESASASAESPTWEEEANNGWEDIDRVISSGQTPQPEEGSAANK